MTDAFSKAFSATMQHEGGYSNTPGDHGGETYMGISRVFWPSWCGWFWVDEWKAGHITALNRDIEIAEDVRAFYRVQFWDRFRGDTVAAICEPVALELFDTAVNFGVHRAVCFLQTALNMQNRYGKVYPDIAVDGIMGQQTILTLKRYLETEPGRDKNELILLNCMNGEQYIAYKQNAQHERFRGWFARV